MPRTRKRRKRANALEEYAHLALRIDDYKARVETSINHYAHGPQYAFRDTEDEPLIHFLANLEIIATCVYPDERAGDTYELTIYGDDHPESQTLWKLKDVQVVDEHYSRKYREYRGNRIPVYHPPKGIGMLDKSRGEPHWHGTIWAQPRYITDLLIVLGHSKRLYLGVRARMIERHRWIQSVSVQTTNPADD